ncbi:hypothetical protein E2320_009539, partial [Naja naja]
AGTKPLSMQKRPVAEKREMIVKKTPVATIKTEANAQTVGKEPNPESSTPSWASDHNYNAVKPEQTPAISPALLFKCMYFPGIFFCSHLFFLSIHFPFWGQQKNRKGF